MTQPGTVAIRRSESVKLHLLMTVNLLVVLLTLLFVGTTDAQVPDHKSKHYLYDYEMQPGMIAHRKLLARQSMQGYYQPVRFVGPAGSEVSVFSEGRFQAASPNTLAGLMVGNVYRLKVTNIPGHPGVELFPSVEIIGRLFPPAGKETKFPIPISIPVEDLEPAMSGSLVTRVVYLENPRTAIAEQRRPNDQPFFDVGLTEDPIRIAEKFGRPMVIVRIGSRIPDEEELNHFGFGSPYLMWFESLSSIDQRPETPADLDPLNLDDLEVLPSLDDGFGDFRDGAVRQVAYLQPVLPPQQENPFLQEETGGPPVPTAQTPVAPAPIVNSVPQEVPQNWSLNDTGVQNNTGLTNDGVVQEFQPATPNIVESAQPSATTLQPLHPVVEPSTNVVSPNAYFDAARSQFPLPPWPDELLIDGGDRDDHALVKDFGNRWEVQGLETEDTIAHYDTLSGRRVVDASNRVLIYAPRFSAVRKIDALGRTAYTNEVGRLQEKTTSSVSDQVDFSSTTLQHLQPARHSRLEPVVGLESRTRGLLVDSPTRIREFDNSFKTYENLRLMRTGIFNNKEKGRLAIALERANSWNTEVAAQSTTNKIDIIIVEDVRRAHETVHIESDDNAQLRLVKVASTEVALPGDIVEFTIRFDNVGARAIGNVTVLDNLTPRLDYIPDSEQCSVDARFVTEANSGGSNILRWEITDPLLPAKGGVIRFKCRVR